ADMSGVSSGVKDAHRRPAPAKSGLGGIESADLVGIVLGALTGWAVAWNATICHDIKEIREMRAAVHA
ncbi:hypothetical protein L195_g050955, partial [Trifolium pratense]